MSEAGEYIWITRWEDFQHYAPERDRAPAWIKAYTKQMDDERYLRLTDRQRALLGDLRVIFATMHGRVPGDTRTITRRRNAHTRDSDLQALNHAGFLDICSREVLDQRLEKLYSTSRATRARPRGRREGELEKEPPQPPQRGGNELTLKKQDHICPICTGGLAFATEQRLADHLANVHDEPQTGAAA